MRKFILVVPFLLVSAAAYAASETIEQIRPAEKPAAASEPPARTDTKSNTDVSPRESNRVRKAARPAANSRSARKSNGRSGRPYENEENEARRLGKQYGITW